LKNSPTSSTLQKQTANTHTVNPLFVFSASPALLHHPLLIPIIDFPYVGATDLSLYWKIDAGDSVSGQERGVGTIKLFLIIVPDILPVS
jgi:hypothetical protein